LQRAALTGRVVERHDDRRLVTLYRMHRGMLLRAQASAHLRCGLAAR
jgi:hypothetical protein